MNPEGTTGARTYKVVCMAVVGALVFPPKCEEIRLRFLIFYC